MRWGLSHISLVSERGLTIIGVDVNWRITHYKIPVENVSNLKTCDSITIFFNMTISQSQLKSNQIKSNFLFFFYFFFCNK